MHKSNELNAGVANCISSYCNKYVENHVLAFNSFKTRLDPPLGGQMIILLSYVPYKFIKRSALKTRMYHAVVHYEELFFQAMKISTF